MTASVLLSQMQNDMGRTVRLSIDEVQLNVIALLFYYKNDEHHFSFNLNTNIQTLNDSVSINIHCGYIKVLRQ